MTKRWLRAMELSDLNYYGNIEDILEIQKAHPYFAVLTSSAIEKMWMSFSAELYTHWLSVSEETLQKFLRWMDEEDWRDE